MSPDQKGIETIAREASTRVGLFTMSPDQKGIETAKDLPILITLRSQ